MKQKYLLNAITAILFSTQLLALPPQIEMDKLALGAKTDIDSKDFSSALEKLEKMKELNLKLPDTYWYHYGVALLELKKPKEAISAFDKYLEQGQGAKFYKEALEKYIIAEKSLKVVFMDNTTGLVWQDEFYTHDEISARDNGTKTGKVQDWHGAKEYCKNLTLAGHNDWRLPSKEELITLATLGYYGDGCYMNSQAKANESKQIDGHFGNSFLNNWGKVYKQMISGGAFWSSSSYINDVNSAWVLDFEIGSTC
ncbi:DUF1566 domain-containing protein, partial [Sulfuricurvum sp.]|uniref:Lcl domain-containing protein n=1 Tax=Sulfuricurvum sp. TaxID=2025608 RepID=UPI003BB68F25